MAVNYLGNFNFSNAIGIPTANNNPCPDQLVGSFQGARFVPNASRVNIDYMVNVTISNKLSDPIVIILESPHKDEFDTITSMALGPAMGKTGDNLKAHFDFAIQNSTIYQFLLGASHDIVLVNAIQYQCSLGNSLGPNNPANKSLRNTNFKLCFNTNDLQKRLNALKPFATINLCTKQFQQNVANIAQSFKNYTYGNHPSSWYIPSNRIIY